ncbi:MAG: hypothetical protein R3350_06690 [Saprospiraceae bacterium]|nr:hypothetical protein [Saprospiraceae bacterium]
MHYYQSTYHSKVYRNFREIEEQDYRAIIHFYEEKEEEIRNLSFDEYFEMLISYTDALFQIGSYQKHLLMADAAIEASVKGNIKFYRGKDIFQQLLFRKSASLFNLRQYGRSDYILRELIKINPYNRDAALLLKKCLRHQTPAFVSRARALAIFLLLLIAGVIVMEVLFVRTFYDQYVRAIEISRNALFVIACLFLIGADLLNRWKAHREVEAFLQSVREGKKIRI